MTGNEYQQLAAVTANPEATEFLQKRIEECKDNGIDLGKGLNAAMGLAGEAGEFEDMLKKWIFHGKDLDMEHLKKELGDVCWYVALACTAFGWKLDDVFQGNIDKLSARYHGGKFNKDYANNKALGDV